MEISQILGEEYLKKFKVYHQATLFEPNWDALLQDHCPLCGNKLKQMKIRQLYFCHSVKHKKPYLIATKRLREIKRKYPQG